VSLSRFPFLRKIVLSDARAESPIGVVPVRDNLGAVLTRLRRGRTVEVTRGIDQSYAATTEINESLTRC